jgi:N-dimethylarginine dimethylaminohydrolase
MNKLKSHSGFQKLKKCVVGISYPPEFYSWITNSRLRNLFEKIAEETEEDFQGLIKTLESFNVEVIRPNTITSLNVDIPAGYRMPGPLAMTPRDSLCMIGETLYEFSLKNHLKKTSGGGHGYAREFYPVEFKTQDQLDFFLNAGYEMDPFKPIVEYVQKFNNRIINENQIPAVTVIAPNGIVRVGKDLYLGTDDYLNPAEIIDIREEFKDYRIKTVSSDGHVDGCMCPVKPGLLLSIEDMESYDDTFPGWEVCYLTGESWNKVSDWIDLKKKNKGKWWIPGYENDNELIDFVETWMQDWVGYVEESVFDVNCLVIDESNILVTSYNKKAFDAFERHSVTPHIVPWRHRYFWDGGLHCITLDLDREGDRMDYFEK